MGFRLKKEQVSNQKQDNDEDMLPEYHFDYTQAHPNRFAPGVEEGSLVVVLEPDIAEVFKTPDSVKNVLRAIIATMPKNPN